MIQTGAPSGYVGCSSTISRFPGRVCSFATAHQTRNAVGLVIKPWVVLTSEASSFTRCDMVPRVGSPTQTREPSGSKGFRKSAPTFNNAPGTAQFRIGVHALGTSTAFCTEQQRAIALRTSVFSLPSVDTTRCRGWSGSQARASLQQPPVAVIIPSRFVIGGRCYGLPLSLHMRIFETLHQGENGIAKA